MDHLETAIPRDPSRNQPPNADLFNTEDRERNISVDLKEILMPDTYYNAYNIWKKESMGKVKNTLKAAVAPHGAGLYKITVLLDNHYVEV